MAEVPIIVKLLIAIGGIWGCFLVGGFTLELLIPKESREDKNFKDPTIIIMVIQNFLSAFLAFAINRIVYRRSSPQTLLNQIQNGAYNSISVFSATKANIYLTFPATNLIKSSKSLSILFISLLFGNKSYSLRESINVVLITSGILLYNFAQQSTAGLGGVAWIGWLLALTSLLADGFFGESQTVSTRKQGAQLYDLMETTNFWAGVFALIFGLVTGDLLADYRYLNVHPEKFMNLVLYICSGVIGQIFIHYTIANFSPLFLSIVTTSRKFASIGLSIFWFDHKLNPLQLAGCFLVIGGVALEILGKYQESKKPKQQEAKPPVIADGSRPHRE